MSDQNVFHREGNDLILEVPVPLSQVVLGAVLRVPTLEGKTDLKVPAGTQAGTRFRLKGKGIKNIKGFGHGDLYVIVNVDIPTSLTKDEKECFEKISKLRGDEKRLASALESLV